MFKPFYYDIINNAEGHYIPSTLKYPSASYNYFRRALYQRAFSVIELTVPVNWDKDYLLYSLFGVGWQIVFDAGIYGVIPQFGTFEGTNLFYKPTTATVERYSKITNGVNAGPIINRRNMIIGKDCEVLTVSPDWLGIADIINFYAEKLATLDASINQSIVNTRYAFLVFAKNKSAAQAWKKIFDKINSGQTMTVADRDILKTDDLNDDSPFEVLGEQMARNYITDKQLADFRTIMNLFDNEIGLPHIQTEKAERLITDEATMNNAETVSRLLTMTRCLNESIERCVKLFPVLDGKLKCEITNFETEGGANYGDSEINADRDL